MIRTMVPPDDRTPVDRRSPTPLHAQVRAALVDLIRRHDLRPGDRLPPEAALCEQFGVARQTLRQAVDGLVQERVLYRQRPKGTFVGFGAVEGDLQVLRSIWEDLRLQGLEPTVEVLSAEARPAGAVASYLELTEDREVLELRRVFMTDGQPICYDLAYFPLPDFGWMAKEDLTTSWYELVAARLGVFVEYARTVVEPAIADKDLARQLSVPKGTPLLKLGRQTYAQGDRLLNYSCEWYRGDRYRFSVVLSRRVREQS